MFNLFKKKKQGEEGNSEDNPDNNPDESAAKSSPPANEPIASSNNEVIKLSSELERVKISVEGFNEVRKSFTERFTRVSEQIGELRSMILERDKTIQEVELKTIKAADLVESVHPEKIMSEVQKQDAKQEALKANLEGNEAILNRVMDELKEAKRKIEFFRGVEEIVKLSEEVKTELIEIKKVESRIGIHADKVETIFSEIKKKFQEIDTFGSEISEMKVISEQNTKDINYLKDKVTGLAEKEELERLVSKVQRYIDALKELEKKSSLNKDISTLKTLLESIK